MGGASSAPVIAAVRNANSWLNCLLLLAQSRGLRHSRRLARQQQRKEGGCVHAPLTVPFDGLRVFQGQRTSCRSVEAWLSARTDAQQRLKGGPHLHRPRPAALAQFGRTRRPAGTGVLLRRESCGLLCVAHYADATIWDPHRIWRTLCPCLSSPGRGRMGGGGAAWKAASLPSTWRAPCTRRSRRTSSYPRQTLPSTSAPCLLKQVESH